MQREDFREQLRWGFPRLEAPFPCARNCARAELSRARLAYLQVPKSGETGGPTAWLASGPALSLSAAGSACPLLAPYQGARVQQPEKRQAQRRQQQQLLRKAVNPAQRLHSGPALPACHW